MSRVLFLDDAPERCKEFFATHPECTIVHDAAACIKKLQQQDWDYVFLDHDLGGEAWVNPEVKNTGSGVVRWILEHRPRVYMFVVHSWNIQAGNNMSTDLNRAGYTSLRCPFGPEVVEWSCPTPVES